MSKESFVLCIDNTGYQASLDVRKVYRAMSDPEAEGHGLVRVIDEDDEDYLFPASLFVPIEVPLSAAKAFSTLVPSGPGPRA
jgi:hypothetical protein